MLTAGSKDLVQLAQWPDFDALDVEAERADFGRLASKASELADLLRVLRGSVMRSPALPKVSRWILVDFGGFWCTGPLVNHDDPYSNPYFNGRKSGGLPDFWDGICGIMWGICQRDGAL